MSKPKKALKESMKKGEMYVIFCGCDFDYSSMSMVAYGDPDRTPRIYQRESFDDRLHTSLPVCSTFRSAVKRTNGEARAVLLPLSEMIRIFGAQTVKKWARVQCHVPPEEVRDYVKRFVSMQQAA